jgi:hypothetical protein
LIAQKPLLSQASALHITWLACVIDLPPRRASARRRARRSEDELDRLNGVPMGATTYLVPPLAILLGWAMLDESPAGLAFVGGALCLAGVIIARRPTAATISRRAGG